MKIHWTTLSLVVVFAACCQSVSTDNCPCECSSTDRYFYPLQQATYFLVNCRNHVPLLTSVPKDLPNATQCLQLNYNTITSIAPLDFQNLTELLYLDLSYNEIQELPAYTFSNNTKLEALLLGSNQLTFIHDTAFEGLNELKDLVLTENALKLIPAAVQNLRSLVSIHLYQNRIESMPSQTFLGLNNLQFVNLHDNYIAWVAQDVLWNLTELNNIYLTANRIENLPPTLFRDNGKLQYIALGNNKLQNLSADVFANLPHLRHLDLRQNYLKTLPSGIFSGLPVLFELHFEDNDIRGLPKDIFDGLSELTLLQMVNNPIGSLPENIFQSSIKVARLGLSHITDIADNTFSPLKNLVHLEIRNSRISTVNSKLFKGLQSLQSLSMKGNQIKNIDVNAFKDLTRLNILLLAQNEIKFLHSGTFKNLSALDTLDLESNGLVHVDDTVFQSLQNLTKLTLHRNNLTRVSAVLLKGLTLLKTLYLQQNKIHNIEDGSFEGLKLQEFDISSNPLFCDCELSWFKDWIDKNGHNFFRASVANTQCSQPEVYNGRSVSTMTTDQFKCVFPTIATQQVSLQVNYGDKATMDCKLSNNSIASLKWTLPDLSKIHQGEMYPGISMNDVGTLYLSNMTTFDTGMYICTSTNDIGSMNLTVDVTVTLPTTTIPPTTTVTVRSSTMPITESKIVTTKGPKKGPSHKSCKPSPCRNGGKCVVLEDGLGPTCICTLLYGGPTCELLIPSTPADLRVVVKTDTTITVAWSQLDDAQQVSSYQILMTNLDGNGTSQTLMVQSKLGSVNLQSLMPNTSYNICIIAVNAAGPSLIDSDKCLVVVTNPLMANASTASTGSSKITLIAIVVAICLLAFVILAIWAFCRKHRKYRLGQYNKYSDQTDGDNSFFSDQVKFRNCDNASLDMSLTQIGPASNGDTDTDTDTLPGEEANQVTSIPSY
ncbi:insulin-like growth factor-binding protein complex acid labile subunit [Ptychodera flava]|uniref:insulin-like growth factor-binding protein complex acid labile subunit n=1 Tax=Ptychodera flava TaxID=63121 RepID=UPI00396A41D1